MLPQQVLGHDIQFAPIGLLDMYNSGGAIEALECNDGESACMVKVQVRGWGRFGAYSNTKTKVLYCRLKRNISCTMPLLAMDY